MRIENLYHSLAAFQDTSSQLISYCVGCAKNYFVYPEEDHQSLFKRHVRHAICLGISSFSVLALKAFLTNLPLQLAAVAGLFVILDCIIKPLIKKFGQAVTIITVSSIIAAADYFHPKIDPLIQTLANSQYGSYIFLGLLALSTITALLAYKFRKEIITVILVIAFLNTSDDTSSDDSDEASDSNDSFDLGEVLGAVVGAVVGGVVDGVTARVQQAIRHTHRMTVFNT